MSVSYRDAGFTIIELLVTLAVAAIILTIAVPSFQGLIERSRLTTEANTLGSALQLARSEAVKRGEDVSLAAGGTTFSDGFCVHSDSSGTSCTDSATNSTLIREFESLESVATSGVTEITFTNMGELNSGAPVSVVISPASCPSGKKDGRRRVSVGVGGQVRVSSEDCP